MTTPSDHSPAYKIFHYYFECAIPAAFAMEEKSRLTGTLVYENAAKEEGAAREMWWRQQTVAEMIELKKRGATITLKNPQRDAIVIYEMLRDHLNKQRGFAVNSLNGIQAPMEDLVAMDEFAAVVYRVARNYQRTDLSDQNNVRRKMDSLFGSRMRRVEKEEPKADADRPIPEHVSVSEEIQSAALERNLRYRK